MKFVLFVFEVILELKEVCDWLCEFFREDFDGEWRSSPGAGRDSIGWLR